VNGEAMQEVKPTGWPLHPDRIRPVRDLWDRFLPPLIERGEVTTADIRLLNLAFESLADYVRMVRGLADLPEALREDRRQRADALLDQALEWLGAYFIMQQPFPVISPLPVGQLVYQLAYLYIAERLTLSGQLKPALPDDYFTA
jgi:hypothetical protein